MFFIPKLMLLFTLITIGFSNNLQFKDNYLENDNKFKYVGKIFKTKGKGVVIDRKWGIGKHRGSKNKKLFDLDFIGTDKKSKAYLKLVDGSKIIVAKGSNMKIVNLSKVEHKRGEITYDIKPRGKTPKLQIITDFAKINIKGTLFKVFDVNGKKKVVLHEGVLDLDFTGKNYTLFSTDPNCGKPFIQNKPNHFEMNAGEALSFDNNNVHRTCFKPKQNYRDTIILSYEKSQGAHLCYTKTSYFNNSKKDPRIKAFKDGCYLKVPTKYKSCEELISFNNKSTKYFIENSQLELVLMPDDKDDPSFIQYKCYR